MVTIIDTLHQIITNIIPTLCIASIFLVIFLIYGLPVVTRLYVRFTGETAYAKVLKVKTVPSLTHSWLGMKEVTAELEVHPQNGDPYVTEDRHVTWTMDFFPLRPGCVVQVRVASGNPKHVVSIPDTLCDLTDEPEDADSQLDKLMNMLNVGMITQQEFDTQKDELLSKL